MRDIIIQGNVLDDSTWADIPDHHVQCCVTSPPYWGLRDYGVEGQLGLEPTPEEYIGRMVQVFRHVWRVLRDDGTLWLNMGDSYAGSGGVGSLNGKQGTNTGSHTKRQTPLAGLKPKDLCGIPWRLALALQADGWYLRQDIIWHKPNPMPESCRDRCTKAHEYIFLLTKKPKYFCDMEAIKEDNVTFHDGNQFGGANKHKGYGTRLHSGRVYERKPGRNKRSVWTIATAPYKEAHFATFPPKLIEPCVLAGTSAKGCCPECGTPWGRVVEKTKLKRDRPNDYVKRTGEPGTGNSCANSVAGVAVKTIGWQPGCECERQASLIGADGTETLCEPRTTPCIVFDPFFGSGTTGMVAKQHGRDYLGIELNPEYIDLINKRIATALPAPLPLLEMK